MPSHDPRVDAFVAKSADFAKPILKHLRALIHANCPRVEETIKWGFPHFLHKGMLCSMAAFKAHCSFGFWKGALVLGKTGFRDDAGHGQFGHITSMADLPSDRVLAGYIRKAVELNEAGVKKPAWPRPKIKRAVVVPADLRQALRKNKKAQATFESFSYSHKKEYVEWLTDAKREETRRRRLGTTIAWLTKGKPRHWQYANC